ALQDILTRPTGPSAGIDARSLPSCGPRPHARGPTPYGRFLRMLRLRHLLPVIVAALTTASASDAQSFRVEGSSPPSMVGFGAAIAFAGQDVIVGRPGMVVGFPMPAGQTGAVHVFRRGPQGWTEAGAVAAEGVGES